MKNRIPLIGQLMRFTFYVLMLFYAVSFVLQGGSSWVERLIAGLVFFTLGFGISASAAATHFRHEIDELARYRAEDKKRLRRTTEQWPFKKDATIRINVNGGPHKPEA